MHERNEKNCCKFAEEKESVKGKEKETNEKKKTNLHNVLLSISLFIEDVCNDAYNRAFVKKQDHYYLFV